MIITGFLFALGVLLCIWCLANLDVVLWGILLLVVIGIWIVAIGAVIAAGIGLWESYGSQMSYDDLNQALAYAIAVSVVGGLWWFTKGDQS